MATLKKTIKDFPSEYADGKIYYHKVNAQFMDIWRKGNFEINDNFNLTVFLTESQRFYLDKRKTWAWFKTYLPGAMCLKLLQETELKDIVEHFALCYHDKDIAKPHTHVLLKFYRNESYLTKIFEFFHCDNISDPSHKLSHCYEYLIHNSRQCKKDKKWVYDEEERIVDDIEYWSKLQVVNTTKDDMCVSIINDIINGVPIYDMVKRYGREYIIHRRHYTDCAISAKLEDYRLKGLVEDDSVNDEF